jgi:hypothetical protein
MVVVCSGIRVARRRRRVGGQSRRRRDGILQPDMLVYRGTCQYLRRCIKVGARCGRPRCSSWWWRRRRGKRVCGGNIPQLRQPEEVIIAVVQAGAVKRRRAREMKRGFFFAEIPLTSVRMVQPAHIDSVDLLHDARALSKTMAAVQSLCEVWYACRRTSHASVGIAFYCSPSRSVVHAGIRLRIR